MATRAQKPDSRRKHDPEGGRHAEELEPARDQQAAAEDHRVGEHHPAIEWAPPEVERLDPAHAEDEEGADKANVRRVEDVTALPLDDVFGRERKSGDDREPLP